MEQWKQDRLIDILDTLIDYRGKTPNKVERGIPLITAKIVKNGRIQKSDTIVAKNYLSDKEVSQLERLSSAFLDFAELRAEQQLITTMYDWKNKLSNFLAISDYEVLKHSGTISNEEAQTKAFCEYEKFKLIQDREYLSDFDKELKRLKDKGLFND